MERRNNFLGYIAIALGAVALIVALGARNEGPNISFSMPGPGMQAANPPAAVQPAPPAAARPAAPQPPDAPDAQPAPGSERGQFNFHTERGGKFAWGDQDGPSWNTQGGPPWARGGQFGPGRHGPFFFAPFFIVGGLLKLLLAVGLIGFGLRMLRRRRGGPRPPFPGMTPSDQAQQVSMKPVDKTIHYM